MKFTKENISFKKIFTAAILALLLLATFIIPSGLNIKTAVLSLNATAAEESIPLYEVDTFYNLVVLTNLTDVQFNISDYPTIAESFEDLGDYFKGQSNGRSGGPINVVSVYMFYDSNKSAQSFKNMDRVDPYYESKEQIAFVKAALDGARDGEIYSDIYGENEFIGSLDANNDNRIDSITIYVPLTITSDDQTTAAWPHTILGYTNFSHKFRGLNYNRFVVNSYRYKANNFLTMEAPIGVMCHEMFHNVGNDAGVQDLYHYSDNSDPSFYNQVPVGNYCIMAATDYQNPQPLNMYYKFKLGWAELEEIKGGEKIPDISQRAAKAIKFGAKDSESSEFFIAQYWPANDYNRNSYYGNGNSREAGVIIYRINSLVTVGNMGNYQNKNPKKLDEVCVFSPATGFELGTTYDISAVLKGGGYSNLTYSDGTSANLNVTVNIGSNSFNIIVERYSLEFRVQNSVTEEWNLVPYEIGTKLSNGNWESTFGGIYLFSYENDYKAGKIISFKECFGYEFYKDEELTDEICEIDLREHSLSEHALDDADNFAIIIYVKAIPRSITLNFKDFEGKALGFTLSTIDYVKCEYDGMLQTLQENAAVPLITEVKNGDLLYFMLDGYRTEILEITPDVKETADVLLRMLCIIEGVVSSNGTLLENVKVTSDMHDIKITVNSTALGTKYSYEFIVNSTVTDADGKFKLENIPQGANITFNLKNYQKQNYKVTQSNLNLSITLRNSSDSSYIVIIVAAVVISLIIIATLISVLATRKKHSYNTNEHYDE